MQSVISVKVQFQNEMRRCDVMQGTNFDALLKHLCDMYSIGSTSVTVVYKDNEGDLVTIRDDSDLACAVRCSPGLLRCHLIEKQNTPSPTSGHRRVRYTRRTGTEIELSLHPAVLAALGYDTMDDASLHDVVNTWKMPHLIKTGLVDAAEVVDAIRVSGEEVPPRLVRLSGGCGRGGRGNGRGRVHPYHHHHGHHHVHGGSGGEGVLGEPLQWGHHHPHHGPPHHKHHGPHGLHHGPPHHAHGPGHHHGPPPHHAPPHHGDGPDLRRASDAMRCRNRDKARFVKDVTGCNDVPVPAESAITRTWRVRNDSNEPWPDKVELIHVGGDDITAGVTAVRGQVAPGSEVDITVRGVAPLNAGAHHSHFRLQEVGGKRFGQRLSTKIVVSTETSSDSDEFVTVAVVAGEKDGDYEMAMQQLREMGFDNDKTNVALLHHFRGNVERVAHRLADSAQDRMKEE